ncbi:hypothetical protein EG68_08604 [Paragonimus skrjabini miyazakii]|uniref:Uncharacterized protein n=1 Tax=Paragonimus skrjabini miyazakii TaxID=59628 RepID=A0A8S9YMS2_9TREM|nr:hypothetical protein EG68_08604 [Paragonimus skrjabini miyazakii]
MFGGNGSFLCIIFLFVFLSEHTKADYPLEFTAQVQSYPNIMRAKEDCLPLKGNYEHAQTYVCDVDRLLTVNQINRLNELLQEFRNLKNRDSSACSPANPNPVIAIALVNKLKVGNENPDRLLSYASIFAYYLFNEWNLPSTCHTGSDKMIIFYSKDDGMIYTFAGNLLERKLPSSRLIDIAVQARLYFSNGIYEGLTYLIQKYRDAVTTGRIDLFSRP